MPSPLAWYVENFILVYQRLAPARVRQSCRFHPSCSAYGLEAVRRHGGARGVWLILGRLNRCRPPQGGEDPVP